MSYMSDYIKRRRDRWIQENGPCRICGSTENLEVDHIDKSTKEIEAKHIWTRKKIDRDRELEKCQVLCRNCHHKKTGDENRVIKHGTLNTYQRHSCRCIECKTFYKQYRSASYKKLGW